MQPRRVKPKVVTVRRVGLSYRLTLKTHAKYEEKTKSRKAKATTLGLAAVVSLFHLLNARRCHRMLIDVDR